LNDHYSFWNTQYNMNLQAGCVGENVTLGDIAEDQVCVGDTVRLGSAVVQVSGPRVPCANLARRIGRSDWVKLTIRENRTGFYLRVLEPGAFQAGDPWIIEERVNQDGSIPAINRCMYLEFDANYARRMLEMSGLEAWWKDQALEKLGGPTQHWTANMKHGG
jgi:MOSC domain-containing protein YiiM